MREIAVHFENEFVIAFEGPFEAGAIGAAEALFFGAMKDVNSWIFGGDFVGELASAVGRIVIDDKDVNGGGHLHDASNDVREIFPLVIRRNDDDGVAHSAADR